MVRLIPSPYINVLTFSSGYRIGRVKAVFTIPKRFVQQLFPSQDPPAQLAYVEWFTSFAQPDPIHGLYKLQKAARNGVRFASIIPLASIRRSIHLYPSFGRTVPADWTSSNVLDKCDKFFVNCFTDRHTYGTVV